MAAKHIYEGTVSALNRGISVKDATVTLNNGVAMPILGLGTYRIYGQESVHTAVDNALKYGYKSIDTASGYGNEADIGVALRSLLPKYNLKREDIFITSKLAPKDQGSSKVQQAVERSLLNLGVDYIDLYLIHWPGAANVLVEKEENRKLRRESWEGLVSLRKQGKLKSIGVSNYTSRHLHDLISNSSTPPAVNQVEFHPYYRHPDELLEICGNQNILLQAYSSFGGTGVMDLVTDKLINEISDKLNVKPGQVLLRWALQCGYAVIPKSVHEKWIAENAELDFIIPDEDMLKINNISHRKKFAWDPETVF